MPGADSFSRGYFTGDFGLLAFSPCCVVVLVFSSVAEASALSKFIQDAAGRVSERRAARLPAVTSSDSVACAEPRSGDQSRLPVC